MKINLLIIMGIISIAIIFGVTQLDKDLESGNYQYGIQGDQVGADSFTKTDLLLTRTNIDDSSDIHTVDLTHDLHYTDNILFLDWQIYSFENHVIVSWVTSEDTWADVFLATSDDYGTTFDVKNISQTSEYVNKYKINYSDETVYIVWNHTFITDDYRHFAHLYFTKSDDFGDSFGESTLLSAFDNSAYEFDLESFDDNVFVVWREDYLQNAQNIWFATSTNRAESFDIETKLQGGFLDIDSSHGILHLTWLNSDHDDHTQILYAYSEDLGQTLHSRVVFDADWERSPYAEPPVPKLTVGNDIVIEFRMDDEEGEVTPFTLTIE